MTDEEAIEDVSGEYEGCVRADRRGGDVLVLYRYAQDFLDPRRYWKLHYAWLSSPDASVVCVQGSENSFFAEAEIDPAKSLFEQLRLFP